MPEIAYWFLLLVITLLALPLIFFLGVLAAGFLLFIMISVTILWFFNQEPFELSVFIIDSILVLSFFVITYFFCLFIFASLGFLILKFTKNRALIRFLNYKNLIHKKKLIKYHSKIFFLFIRVFIKKIRWIFWLLLPIFLIAFFLTKQKFDHNELWI